MRFFSWRYSRLRRTILVLLIIGMLMFSVMKRSYRVFAEVLNVTEELPDMEKEKARNVSDEFYRKYTWPPFPVANGDSEKYYVTFNYDDFLKDGRALGNQMFCLASVIYVAALSGRRPALLASVPNNSKLLDTFALKIPRISNLSPCRYFQEKFALSYDENVETLGQPEDLESKDCKLIALRGFFQSWKYTRHERLLRDQFKFHPDVIQFCREFMKNNTPDEWEGKTFVCVGVHVRRGDVISRNSFMTGYTSPSATYFQKAMDYMVKRFKLVQFVVSSDDQKWIREYIVSELLVHRSLNTTNIVHFDDTPARSLAVLSLCDHVIMSTGTFGWWGAWLAGGTTIYYSNWPRRGSHISSLFNSQDFFPPHWIGMND